MAAMEKQNEETKNETNACTYTSILSLRLSTIIVNDCNVKNTLCAMLFPAGESAQDTKSVSVLMGVVKDASVNKAQTGIGRGRGRPISIQASEVQH